MNITAAHRAILIDLSNNGDNVPKAIADNTGYSRAHVQRSLKKLSDNGLTMKKNEYGVWTLSEDGHKRAQELEKEGFRKPS